MQKNEFTRIFDGLGFCGMKVCKASGWIRSDDSCLQDLLSAVHTAPINRFASLKSAFARMLLTFASVGTQRIIP